MVDGRESRSEDCLLSWLVHFVRYWQKADRPVVLDINRVSLLVEDNYRCVLLKAGDFAIHNASVEELGEHLDNRLSPIL